MVREIDRLRVALVGSNGDALLLAQAMTKIDRIDLVAAYDAEPYFDRLRRSAPFLVELEDWVAIFAGKPVEAVLVAPGSSPEHNEILRRLVQQSMPLLLVHPACESILALELDMIRADTGCPMTAYFPAAYHPAIGQLAELMRAGASSPLGVVEQLIIERNLVDGDRREALAKLVRDAAIVRMLAGTVDKVSALGGESGSAAANLSVNMTTAGGVLCRWSVMPAEIEGGRLIVVGARGKASLAMPSGTRRWRLDIEGVEQASYEFPEFDAAVVAVERFAAAVRKDEASSNWTDACRDLEVGASAEESLRRSRTIPIYDQQPSEEQTFKGMMAAGGCGVIVVALLVLFIWAVVEGVRMPRRSVAPTGAEAAELLADQPPKAHILLRLWPVYPLAIFLMLQLLWLVFPRRRKTRDDGPSQTNAPADMPEGKPQDST